MLMLVQKGEGSRRTLVCTYFVDAEHAVPGLAAALGPDVCLLQDLDDTHGRFAAIPGHGGVDPIEDVVAFAHEHAGEFEVGEIVLIGWSAGCQALREQLRADEHDIITGVIALDGISGAVPPLDVQMAPWLRMLDRAMAEAGAFFAVSHTQMRYTEALPVGQRFASTVRTAGMLCEHAGIAAPEPGAEATAGCNFHVISSPSADMDGDAHKHQVRVVLLEVVQRFLVAWLASCQPQASTDGGS